MVALSQIQAMERGCALLVENAERYRKSNMPRTEMASKILSEFQVCFNLLLSLYHYFRNTISSFVLILNNIFNLLCAYIFFLYVCVCSTTSCLYMFWYFQEVFEAMCVGSRLASISFRDLALAVCTASGVKPPDQLSDCVFSFEHPTIELPNAPHDTHSGGGGGGGGGGGAEEEEGLKNDQFGDMFSPRHAMVASLNISQSPIEVTFFFFFFFFF
jgi:hypothetical protein